MSHFDLPSDSKTVLFDLNRQVEDLSRQLSKILQAAQGLSAGSQQFVASVLDFDIKFQDLLIAEMISTNPTVVEENKFTEEDNLKQTSNSERLVSSIRDLSFVGKMWAEKVKTTSNLVDYKILESIRFEVGLISRLKDLLKRRKDVIKLHDKSVQKKVLHEREKALATSQGQIEQVNKLERKIAEDNDRVKNTYDHAIFITKGLFFSGIRHFAKVKATRLEKLRTVLCQEFQEYHNQMERVWANQITN